jgi:hypothetical protein
VKVALACTVAADKDYYVLFNTGLHVYSLAWLEDN